MEKRIKTSKKIKKIKQMIRQAMLKIQIQKLIHKLSQKKYKTTVSYSFTVPLILSKLDIQINDSDSTLIQYSYGIFVLSLIGFFVL
jgi:hypothetical protein